MIHHDVPQWAGPAARLPVPAIGRGPNYHYRISLTIVVPGPVILVAVGGGVVNHRGESRSAAAGESRVAQRPARQAAAK